MNDDLSNTTECPSPYQNFLNMSSINKVISKEEFILRPKQSTSPLPTREIYVPKKHHCYLS
jgi:hypothetical protein